MIDDRVVICATISVKRRKESSPEPPQFARTFVVKEFSAEAVGGMVQEHRGWINSLLDNDNEPGALVYKTTAYAPSSVRGSIGTQEEIREFDRSDVMKQNAIEKALKSAAYQMLSKVFLEFAKFETL